MSNITTTQKYEQLLSTISSAYEVGRVRAVNVCDTVAPIELVTYRRAFED